MQKKKKEVTIYCDGSSLGNPGPGGWACILEYKGVKKELCGASKQATNNQMELTAVIEGLRALKEPCSVTIITDSSYVANAMNEWLDSWIQKDFKKVKNKELWQEFVNLQKIHDIKAVWVKGHNGHSENERCDTLARAQAQKIKES